jgi:predicted NAD-dependent protein-ADP-ribosyltransferase YbiA (DUF1768 family)/DNA-directed RNA polymerase subunit K/omega
MATIFMFNVNSAHKTPGKGILETINEVEYTERVYKTLHAITNWRRMLSNAYPSPIDLDGFAWPTVEHYCCGKAFKEDTDGGDGDNRDDGMEIASKFAVGGEYTDHNTTALRKLMNKYRYNFDDICDKYMEPALLIKFSDQNLEFKEALLHTRNATLTHWNRGDPIIEDEHGHRIAERSKFTRFLERIRAEMLGVLSNKDGTMIDANSTNLEYETTTTTTTTANTNTTLEHETTTTTTANTNTTLEHETTTTTTANTNTTLEDEHTTTTNTNTALKHEHTTTTNTNTALKHETTTTTTTTTTTNLENDTAYAYDSNATDTTMNEKDMVLDGVAAMHVNNTENTDINISLEKAGGVLDCPGASMGAQITETDQPYTDTTIVTSTIPSGNFDAPSISSLGLKILAKKEVHDYDSFQSKYDPSNNKSVNVLTIYEKTNVIGIRMEQLAMGGQSYLEPSILRCLNNVKDIAMKEFEQRKIPFIICRKFSDNIKEYWKLNDLIY